MPCETCECLRDQDALAMPTLEVVATHHNTCAPITHYTCRCKTCGTRWVAMELYDEDGVRPTEWTWTLDETATSGTRPD